MKKTVSQIAKEFYRNWWRVSWEDVPFYYHPSPQGPQVVQGQHKFHFKNSWKFFEDGGKDHLEKPFCLWADAHTISVEDEVITITRDENNHVSQHTYELDSFNTICVKNLDEARKIENNRGLFGGLYVVDYSTRKVYRLVAKLNDKVRLERICNPYVTKLPWFYGKTIQKTRQDGQVIEEAFGGTLDTTNLKPSENGY
tara:strand:+ start:176 stop:769 length:594 start_codon:yes stop_codon:yes gene_type:complete